jgi:hypothetical protein
VEIASALESIRTAKLSRSLTKRRCSNAGSAPPNPECA